ncbi:class I SAM-dependent methyltransferase [Sabulilitoribacter arenilitoris]|uniref:Class I SAM-dependent methyltransferase n=1 Tax=Wocania arenilitoris TaxID=2044858 RepID=A0AAE3EQP7_9FLAO|nr:class I SAM-dependent methyltransferase [Wocania arenilitoris]MCF7569148.1 class I SAM-dependent methyltransferase [Wocania arenilitoris]
MNHSILNTDIQEFINSNLNSSISKLLLKGIAFNSVETKEVVEQIEAKKRCEKKLSTWFNTENIYYPNKLSIEQTSSEITANYKSSLISGDSIIDLTGGFGVDCYYFSKRFKSVKHCEINNKLSEIVKHNYKQLDIQNIKTCCIDGIEYIKTSKKLYNWIYLDPSRRHDRKGKVFFLNDCLPNVPEHLDILFKHSKNILIKTSPLLDFSIGINELKHVKTIHVVAINNDVKELLWVLESNYSEKISIKTVNIKKDKEEHFNFLLGEEKLAQSNYKLPLSYLYEPNSAILKAGGFHSISKKIDVFKLHQHSHLYTSEQLLDFPGRCFKIENILPYNKKELKKEDFKKANITIRNFPETVQGIRKKFNIKEGGNLYLFFTTDLDDNKIVITCTKTN